ncbi:hypothetical protein IAR55_000146 [Kwoniella newhampshirensis]|uniref:Hemerythrin-like domain-containing protein n=1 Tax=Kwoniella newhampshirensis TaxID=1651941 RepID=A0AAW0Z6J5_9TREE
MAVRPHPRPDHPSDSPFRTKEYQDVIAYLRQMGAGTIPPKWSDRPQWEMPHVHLFLMASLENTYLYADWAVENKDLINYLGYADISFFQVYKHHSTEEEYVFPTWSEKAGDDIWLRNIEEHHTFETPLHAGWHYVRYQRSRLVIDPSPIPEPKDDHLDMSQYPDLDLEKPFDPIAFRRHMASFVFPLVKHLGAEISTLAPELIEKVGQGVLKEIMSSVEKDYKSYNPSWFLCAAYTSAPMDICKQLIPLPWILRRVLLPFVFGPKYRNLWLYAPHPENLTWNGSA